MYRSNPAKKVPHHTLPSLSYYWQPYSYSSWLCNNMYAGDFNNKVINHISWMKVVMKVCLSEMYLSFMYISCHYYCVIVRIFKNILYQSISRSMCSYIVYSLHYNHCIISLLPPFKSLMSWS